MKHTAPVSWMAVAACRFAFLFTISLVLVLSASDRGNAASECTWTGDWNTTYGLMTLVQSGSSVTGSYTRQTSPPLTGTINGTVYGNVLSGTWRESDGDDGPFEFTMQAGCTQWEGYWRHDDGWFDWPWYGTSTDYVPDGIALEFYGYDPETSSTSFEQGEAVTISGTVTHNGAPTPPDKNRVELIIQAPGTSAEGAVFPRTDDNAVFSTMVFAGWNIGEYMVTASCKVWDEDEETFVQYERQGIFEVVRVEPGDINGSAVAEITSLYKQQVPTGPIRRYGAYGIEKPKYVPESLWGCVHNLEYSGTWVDPDRNFVCGGYQSQVLHFFNALRFNENPEKRKLLRGFDYGPIARGHGIIGAHHSVVLFPAREEWKPYATYEGSGNNQYIVWVDRNAKVFDPWPTQKPAVYSVTEFEGPYGGSADVDHYWLDATDTAKLFSGYPITEAAVCSSEEFLGTYADPPMEPTYVPGPYDLPDTSGDQAYYLENSINSFVVKCPVDVLITNHAGERIGVLSDGTYVNETDGWSVVKDLGDGEKGWYFELPPDESYTGTVTGTSDGTFNLYMNGTQLGEVLAFENEPVDSGEEAGFTVHSAARDLTLETPGGTSKTPEVIPPPSPVTGLWPETFDFDDSSLDGWTDEGSGVWSVIDGRYVMQGNQGNYVRATHHDQTYTNVRFEADVSKSGGDSDTSLYGYGLRVRTDGSQSDYYEFNVIQDGRYMIGRSIDWNFSQLAGWASSDALNAGYGEWNRLAVAANGPFLEFYANDTLLTALEDHTFTAGKVSLFAVDAASSSPADTVQFDNLVIQSLPDQAERTLYIPHITAGAADWTDYLQVDSSSRYPATVRLTLYSGGSAVYNGLHTVEPFEKLLIDLKSLDNTAECGVVTCYDPGLHFRVSYENKNGGGVAEFALAGNLARSAGFYFSDFTPSVEYKGMALANFGDTPASVTLTAMGGGSENGRVTLTIDPRCKKVGVHTAWFPELPLSQVKRIVATTGTPALAGIAISGDISNRKLLFTPASDTAGSGGEVYIPHVTGGAPDWIDYLQADNNGIESADFTLTLFGQGAVVYTGDYTVEGLSETLIDIKALNRAAESGVIRYTSGNLHFRVSHENTIGGGVAEFSLTGTLVDSAGCYFSDFAPSISYKGLAVTNFGSDPATVQVTAVGGGTEHETLYLTVGPKQKLLGIHAAWFPDLALDQVDRIVARAGSASLCGIAITGDNGSSRLLFTPAAAVSP